MTDEGLAKLMEAIKTQGAAYQAQVNGLHQRMAALEATIKANNEQLKAQLQWLNALQTLVTASAGTLPMVIGVVAATRQTMSGKEWLDSAKRSALAQLPARGDPNSTDAKTAEFVAEIFDRIEIDARSAEGTGGMH